MSNWIQLGDVRIAVTRKDVRNVHLSVYPPEGRVTLVVPKATRAEVARAYAATRMPWIRDKQAKLRSQARETPRRFVERESHYLWGRRHLLALVETDAKPSVRLDHRRITLIVRPGSSISRRRELIHEWHKALLHATVPLLIARWERKLRVTVSAYHLQRMKTRWGSCNHRTGSVRLNTELVKKPKDLLEYVVVHEMMHLIEPSHGERFVALMDKHYPTWREARAELNDLPLGAEEWGNPERNKVKGA
jgi:predicted metal-dependent hydrolase